MSGRRPSAYSLSANFSYPADYTPTDLRLSKRKRNQKPQPRGDDDSGEDELTASQPSVPASHVESPPSRSNEVSHYIHASAAMKRPLHTKKSFPHSYLETPDDALTPKQIRSELANLKPPLHLPLQHGPDRKGPSIKQRNVAVLVAIMHRCLLNKDWVRAGRAWGMLIHTRFGTGSLDIRKDGLYGLGAELLLRQNRHLVIAGSAGSRSRPGHSAPFSDGAFDSVRWYYQSLAQHFPHRRPRSTFTDALDFNLIMFGLWISALQDYQDRERDGRDPNSVLGSDSGYSHGNDSDSYGDTFQNGDNDISYDPWARKQECLECVISSAEAIHQDMDDALRPPLTSDHQALIELQKQVQTWLEDLKRHRHGGST